MSAHKYQKCLNIWSMLTMIVCCVKCTFSFMYTLSFICRTTIYISTYVMTKVFLTFYQIYRLKTCFNSSVPKYTFIILFMNGVFIILSIQIIQSLNVYPLFDTKHNICYLITTKSARKFTLIVMLWYYIWDIFVLYKYISKVKMLRSNATITSHIQQATVIIYKVSILTVMHEIVSFVATIIPLGLSILSSSNNMYGVRLIIGNIDVVLSCFIMCLMTQHQHKRYVPLMR
eukprot:UN07356